MTTMRLTPSRPCPSPCPWAMAALGSARTKAMATATKMILTETPSPGERAMLVYPMRGERHVAIALPCRSFAGNGRVAAILGEAVGDVGREAACLGPATRAVRV